MDQLFGLVVKKLKEQKYNVTLELAIPCLNYTNNWKDSKYYDIIFSHSDVVNIITKEEYKPYLMQIRNKYMVDNSDLILAIYNGDLFGYI